MATQNMQIIHIDSLGNIKVHNGVMKVKGFSQKQNLNFDERQAFASFNHGFFQV